MSSLKIWFPDFYTEAHRIEERGLALVLELEKHGVRCEKSLSKDCDFILCGSIYRYEQVVAGSKRFPGIPTIHYNWDLYPFQIENNPDLWLPYLYELRKALDVWVPSACTVTRTLEFTERNAFVIRAPILPFEVPKIDYRFVFDPMRDYPDPNRGWVERACAHLGLRYVSGKKLGWEKYKEAIGEAAMLVSAYVEASTGSLSLLEGYWHGKSVLLPTSPTNGGVDYFNNRARYFDYLDFDHLVTQIDRMWTEAPKIELEDARDYINRNFTDAVFAKNIADRLWGLVC